MKDPIDRYDPTPGYDLIGPRLSIALVDQKMRNETVGQPR